ncbi:hypothetical protein O181_060008 [Austropuccinia psidii MF-1]|uniref:Integrase catalytic domain-containing protein n=1 Tax=Austropuccinia psidii MF-1 TaxID=1389203 RepID=A0A9Q3EFS4_9BASI|nr:hypothetical protein [Austropuccinia psidii MF-1]
MQATVASPSSTLGNLFQQNVQFALSREATILPFEEVARIIKEESNNIKHLDDIGHTSSILAIQSQHRVERRNNPAPPCLIYQHPNMPPLPNNPIVIQQYGSKCSYCQKDGHWYVDCSQYEKDYKEKGLRLERLPRKFQYLEPHTALTNNRTAIRTIQPDLDDDDPDIIDARHISEIDDGKILIDSGASAHQIPKQLYEPQHETNKGSYPKFLQTDNAKEYVSAALTNFCDERGIKNVPVVAYTPADNGEAERLNRTIGEAARTMLHSSRMPEKFWPYAYQVATYLHNRIPNKRTNNSTPIELMFGIKPSPSKLYQFGSKAIIQIPSPSQPKLAPQAYDAILVGYPTSGRGWIFYDPSNHSIVHSSHAVFPESHEAQMIKSDANNKMNIDNLLHSLTLQLGEVPTSKIMDQQQSNIDNTRLIPDLKIPNNIKDAMLTTDAAKWLDAAENELQQFDKLNVWTAVDATPNIKVLGAQWIFALKRDNEGKIIRHKALYVVKGFTQRPGQDFGDCYAPTASLVTLCLILTLKVQKRLHIAMFDISGAYLNSPIEEEIYVKAPTELRPKLKGKVMKLNKALYGTKQAARCWWLFFKSIMASMGLVEMEVEASLYVYKKGDSYIIIWMHVDDGVLLTNDNALLSRVQSQMTTKLEVKWNHQPDRIVGINLNIVGNELHLDQRLLATQIVETYPRHTIIKSTPLPFQQCDPEDATPISIKEFQHFIGLLMYLTSGSRPDLDFSVNFLARYSHSPMEECWKLLDHLIGYLKKTTDKVLKLSPNMTFHLALWTDANWGGTFERSTSGGLITYAGCPIQWISIQQRIVAMSTCAAEYVAMGNSGQHFSHLINILKTIDVSPLRQ